MTGCTSLPPGVDGQLADDWVELPAPSALRPQVGQCRANPPAEQMSPLTDRPVDCTQRHYVETVYVGQFTGEAAALPTPPLTTKNATGVNAKAQSEAFTACTAEATKYVGHSWFHPTIWLRITLPIDSSWQAGNRWYACDLVETDWNIGGKDVGRTASLKTEFPDAICFDENESGNWRDVPCSQKHSREFVGGYILPAKVTKEPSTDTQWDVLHGRCWPMAAAYVGVTTSRLKQLTGITSWWSHEQNMWSSGRRIGWCFLWTGDKKSEYVTGSARGRKGKGL